MARSPDDPITLSESPPPPPYSSQVIPAGPQPRGGFSRGWVEIGVGLSHTGAGAARSKWFRSWFG